MIIYSNVENRFIADSGDTKPSLGDDVNLGMMLLERDTGNLFAWYGSAVGWLSIFDNAGSTDDSPESNPANNATLIALIKGVLTLQNTIISNQQTIITAVQSIDTQVQAGINVSIL